CTHRWCFHHRRFRQYFTIHGFVDEATVNEAIVGDDDNEEEAMVTFEDDGVV
ncbi:hypothetical protein NDU88_001500, partial [Pleurodeles waltl]